MPTYSYLGELQHNAKIDEILNFTPCGLLSRWFKITENVKNSNLSKK